MTRQSRQIVVLLLLGGLALWFQTKVQLVNWSDVMDCRQMIATTGKNDNQTTLRSAHKHPPLRNIHIVMIGDSLMRYQYLSLAYRLKYDVWFEDSMWYFHLVNEESFADPYHNFTWGSFLFHTHGILHPQEATCDCHRRNVKRVSQIVENRYYHDPVLNNSVVYLLAYGHRYPIKGRLQPQHVWNQTKEWQMKAFTEFHDSSTWRYSDWSDAIRHHVRYLEPQPRHIVLNAGLWNHKFGWKEKSSWKTNTGDLSEDTLNLLQVMKETPEYEYVWRTTTVARNGGSGMPGRDAFMCERLAKCVNVSFSQHVRRDLYWDDNHFYAPFYRASNEEMMEELGYLPDNYVRMKLSDILEP